MELTPGKHFMNYYWMEGPLAGDQGCRVTVLHSGQDRQCSHCLQTSTDGCLGQGQGKVCKELGTKMKRMSEYMHELKIKTGYESLKSQYMQKCPPLGSNNKSTNEQMDEEVSTEQNPD